MKKIRRKSLQTNIYGSPSKEFPSSISSQDVKGKKPSGWNWKRSTYHIKVKLSFHVKFSRGGFDTTTTHDFTEKNAVFSHPNIQGSDKLETRINATLNKKAQIWKSEDVSELERTYPDADAVIYQSKGSSTTIRRIA